MSYQQRLDAAKAVLQDHTADRAAVEAAKAFLERYADGSFIFVDMAAEAFASGDSEGDNSDG